MTRSFRLSLLGFALAFSPVVAASPTAKVDPNPESLLVSKEQDEAARKLVQKLGSKAYTDRDEASRELANLGRLALPALTHAVLTETNAEIRLRCELLLPNASAEEVRAKLDCFLADKDSKYKHELPGAKQFFDILGKSEGAKNLFRDIALSPENRQLIFGVDGDRDEYKTVLLERRSRFNGRATTVIINGQPTVQQQVPTLTDIVAILFAEIHVPAEATAGRAVIMNSPSYILNSVAFRDGATGAKTKEALAGLMEKWVGTRTDAYSLYLAMNQARNQNLPHGMMCAKRLLSSKVTGPGTYKGYGMTYVAQNCPAEESLKLLEDCLKDEGTITTVFMAGGGGIGGAQKRVTVQVRDLALAMSLVVSKQDPADYGLTFRYGKNTNDSLKYNISAYYFDDENKETRDKAFKKFGEWKEAQAKEKK